MDNRKTRAWREFSFAIPDSWCARSFDRQALQLYRACDAWRADEEDCPRIWIQEAKNQGEDIEEASKKEMARRVLNGGVELQEAPVAGRAGLRCEWTTGVGLVYSYFFWGSERIIEAQIVDDTMPGDPDFVALATEILQVHFGLT